MLSVYIYVYATQFLIPNSTDVSVNSMYVSTNEVPQVKIYKCFETFPYYISIVLITYCCHKLSIYKWSIGVYKFDISDIIKVIKTSIDERNWYS